MAGYSRWDSTLRREDTEEVEYPIFMVNFKSLKDAKEFIKARAFIENMAILNNGIFALIEYKSTNEETGITIEEKEWYRIDKK